MLFHLIGGSPLLCAWLTTPVRRRIEKVKGKEFFLLQMWSEVVYILPLIPYWSCLAAREASQCSLQLSSPRYFVTKRKKGKWILRDNALLPKSTNNRYFTFIKKNYTCERDHNETRNLSLYFYLILILQNLLIEGFQPKGIGDTHILV